MVHNNLSANVSVDGGNLNVALADGPNLDAFARLRTSDPETIFDSKQIFDNQPLFWDDQEVSGSGTSSVYTKAKASTEMSVSASTAGKRVRQTFMRFNYQPGKSQLVFLTGTLGNSGGGTGIKRAAGIFDDDNGIFMMDDEGTLKAVIRSSVSGSAVDNAVAQSSWNLDTLDGSSDANNPSGRDLDPTKSQIIIIDYEWLGVGRVRIGFVIDGIPVYVHQFLHANVLEGVYMSTPNLPLRYEIENDGTGVASSLEHICTTIMSEAGTQENGILRNQSTGSITNLLNNNSYAAVGIRLKGGNLGATINLLSASVIVTSGNDQIEWALVFNPTVAGTFTYNDQTNSSVQIAVGSNNNTVTGGTHIDGGFFTSGDKLDTSIFNALRLGSTISGTPDEFVLVLKPITNNLTVEASLTWREL